MYPDSFYAAVLRAIHAPVTTCTIALCKAWQACEGSHAEWNPWDTELTVDPCTDYNSVGVKNYGDEATGVHATVRTLANGLYPHIIHALQTEDAARFGEAVDASPWGTRGVAAYLRDHPAPKPGVPLNGEVDAIMTKLPTLAEGAGMPPRPRNTHVRNVQALLNAHGHHVDIDGRFGRATKTAVQAFQGMMGLHADGTVGQSTWGKLLDV